MATFTVFVEDRPSISTMSFTDKVAIVTGASSGIGAATAIALAKKGAKVVLVARNEKKLNNVAKQCEQDGKKPLIIQSDVSKDEEIKTIVKETIDKFGKIDILVNNAGIGGHASILDEKVVEVFDHVLGTNLRSVVILTHLAAPYLIKTKGNIVNVSSVATFMALGDMSYNVSKAALDHFTRCVALDLAQHGVRANCVNPGPVKTDILDNMSVPNPDLVWESFKEKTALNRIGDSEEIADLILFLASDKARSITGSSYVSDNGILLKS